MSMGLRYGALIALSASQLLVSFDVATGNTIVVPPIPGPNVGGNVAPFGVSEPTHYQQVYGAALFGGAALIESLAFYPPWGEGTYLAENLVVSLGHTLAPVDGLVFPLESNVNGTLEVVVSAAQFTQQLRFDEFSLIFDLSDDPFLYDPSRGNLLLDVRITDTNLNQVGVWSFVGRAESGDLTSRAYRDRTANADTFGLSTEFVFTPTVIPEPATALLVAWGLAAIGISRRYGQRRDAKGGKIARA